MRGYINISEIRMYAAFILILLPIAALCYKGSLSIGTIPAYPLLAILTFMLAGSFVEIPVLKTRSKKTEQLQRFAPLIEDIYAVPIIRELNTGKERVFDTTITLNLGGCIVPLIAIIYLFLTMSNITALQVMLIVIIAVTLLSEMVNGVGIVVPQYIGMTAIPFSLLTTPQYAGSVTFIAGIGGIILGTIATTIAFNKENSGSAYISIGGAGNFKAIYITALLASLISYFT
ncbi:MAG: DUF1614 domain-containing protein [Methanosarcinaceae archaeon]|nr:DUF1614 domain-containing protein [Methanosarcinaceae archaeon]